jgi:DNA (cytosine-5)-methyltransferase 1
MRCAWQCEIDPFCRRVLAKHWPDVRRHDDVRTFPPDGGDWSVDLIAGGFPCQDISSSGLKRGISGPQSGLWSEFARIVRELRPRLVLVENVSVLVSRGLDQVLCDLAALGFDAEWETLPAAVFGLPQRRERLFLVAHLACGGFAPGPFSGIPKGQTHSITRNFLDGLAKAELATQEAPGRVLRMDDGLAPWMDRVAGCGRAVAPDVAEWIGRRIIASVTP